MNKRVFLVFLCSFLMTSNIVSMNLDSYSDISGEESYEGSSFESILEFSAEEDEIASNSEVVTPGSAQLAPWIGLDHQLCPLAAPTWSSSEETEDITCPYCDTCLLNTSFEFIEQDNEYVCIDCTAQRPWLKTTTEDLTVDTSSEYSEIEMLTSKAFEDDERLFDHKKGNARSHAISRHYREKRSSIGALEKEMRFGPLSKQNLRSLSAQKNLVLARKPKLPNL